MLSQTLLSLLTAFHDEFVCMYGCMYVCVVDVFDDLTNRLQLYYPRSSGIYVSF